MKNILTGLDLDRAIVAMLEEHGAVPTGYIKSEDGLLFREHARVAEPLTWHDNFARVRWELPWGAEPHWRFVENPIFLTISATTRVGAYHYPVSEANVETAKLEPREVYATALANAWLGLWGQIGPWPIPEVRL